MKKSKFILLIYLWFCSVVYFIPGIFHFFYNSSFQGRFSNAADKNLIFVIVLLLIFIAPITYISKSNLSLRKIHFIGILKSNLIWPLLTIFC